MRYVAAPIFNFYRGMAEVTREVAPPLFAGLRNVEFDDLKQYCRCKPYFPDQFFMNSILLQTAIDLAKQAHKGQFRRDGVAPYF